MYNPGARLQHIRSRDGEPREIRRSDRSLALRRVSRTRAQGHATILVGSGVRIDSGRGALWIQPDISVVSVPSPLRSASVPPWPPEPASHGPTMAAPPANPLGALPTRLPSPPPATAQHPRSPPRHVRLRCRSSETGSG